MKRILSSTRRHLPPPSSSRVGSSTGSSFALSTRPTAIRPSTASLSSSWPVSRALLSTSIARPSINTAAALARDEPDEIDVRELAQDEPAAAGSSSSAVPGPAAAAAEDAGVVGHAVISAFDLFSIGVGPSSSHTVGPMRAGKIFVTDLAELGMLEKVKTLKVTLHGSLAATGKGHMTPQAIMLGLEGSDPETVETSTINSRYEAIVDNSSLLLGGSHRIVYSMDADMLWRMDALPTHPNGMRFSVFGESGDLLATNEYFSVGGGFVVNQRTQIDENLFYRAINKKEAAPARRDQTHGAASGDAPQLAPPSQTPLIGEDASGGGSGQGGEGGAAAGGADEPASKQPPFLFHNAQSLEALTRKHNLSIAQVVWNNELSYLSSDEISDRLMRLWGVMDACIRDGVSSTEETLPGRLKVRRRAPALYRRLFKGFYPSVSAPKHAAPPIAPPSSSSTPAPLSLASGIGGPPPSSTSPSSASLAAANAARSPRAIVTGSFDHPLPVTPWKQATFPGIDFLSCYAIAVNEVNAAGGRIVTAPTNGASGVIPAVLKYVIEFISSDDPERDIKTFLLTAAAIGMLYKRGATISAAEGGCMAEVGVASSMAAAGFTACLGGSPQAILQAAEIGIEHSLGLTCDPIEGLVQIPCIERNSLGAVKAVCAAQLAMAGDGIHSVSLDEAIEAMRLTARDMHLHYKETSLSGLATTVRIPLSSPAC